MSRLEQWDKDAREASRLAADPTLPLNMRYEMARYAGKCAGMALALRLTLQEDCQVMDSEQASHHMERYREAGFIPVYGIYPAA